MAIRLQNDWPPGSTDRFATGIDPIIEKQVTLHK
jgi:hypothetical protein